MCTHKSPKNYLIFQIKPRSIILTRFLAQEEKKKQLEKENKNNSVNHNPTTVTVDQNTSEILDLSVKKSSKIKWVWWHFTNQKFKIRTEKENILLTPV